MQAGLIPIISDNNGVKDLIKKIKNELIITRNEDYKKQILKICSLNDEDLLNLKKKFKQIGSRFKPIDEMDFGFKIAFNKILSKIEK